MRKNANRERLIFGLILIIAVAIVIYLNHQGILSVELAIGYLEKHEAAAPVIFIALYVVMVICLLPTLPLNLGAGFLWGALSGMSYSVAGASAGALACFLISRYLIRDFLNNKMIHSTWAWTQREVGRMDWRLVAVTRINPIFPIGPTSYFFGLTEIPLVRYQLATTLSIAPLSLFISAIGASMHEFVFDGGAQIITGDILLGGVGVTVLVVLQFVFAEKSGKVIS